MRAFLVDFKTAEEIKRALGESEELIRCRNILGQEERVAVGPHGGVQALHHLPGQEGGHHVGLHLAPGVVLQVVQGSVVGVVGRPVGDRLKVLDVELAEHGKRAMMDGQIDDIRQVAGLARTVTERLEDRGRPGWTAPRWRRRTPRWWRSWSAPRS